MERDEVERIASGLELGFWIEETPYGEIELDRLPEGTERVFLAARKGEDKDGLKKLLKELDKEAIGPGLWPLIPDKGYYISPWNLNEMKDYTMELIKEYNFETVALDIEHYAQRAGSYFPTRYLRKEHREDVKQDLESIVDLIHDQGVGVMAVTFPLPRVLNSVFGISDAPGNCDEFNAMLYTSPLRMMLPGGVVDHLVDRYIKGNKDKRGFSVSLGLIYEGVNSRNLTRHMLYKEEGMSRDVNVLRNNGISRAVVYSADPFFR